MCYYHLEVGKRVDYAFENTCNNGEFKHRVLEKYLFDTFCDTSASQWGGNIPESTWNKFENVQKHFLTKFQQVMKQMLATLLLLETRSLPIEIMAMERVV